MKNRIIYPFIFNASVFFMLISLLLNAFFEILYIDSPETMLPSLGVNFITYLISILLSGIISTIVVIICTKRKKQFFPRQIMFLYYAANLYTFMFLSINLSTVLLKNIWNIWTVLMLFILSFAVSCVHYFIKLKSFLLKGLLYFSLFAIVYFIITLRFGNFGEGHRLLIVIGIYLISFVIIAISVYFLNKAIKKNEKENKKYDKIFK